MAQLTVQPIVHVTSLADAVAFYEAIGFRLEEANADGDWAELSLGGSRIGLLAHAPNPEQGGHPVELALVADEPLDTLATRFAAAGAAIHAAPAPQPFGEQMIVISPDGLLVKVNRFGPPAQAGTIG